MLNHDLFLRRRGVWGSGSTETATGLSGAASPRSCETDLECNCLEPCTDFDAPPDNPLLPREPTARESLLKSSRALPRGLLLGSMSFPVVILAGGLATRLRPLTEKIPKALVEVAGRPFLEHQLDLLKQNSIAELILCVGYLGEMIEQRCGDGAAFGVPIRCSFDGPILLGTGGVIKRASALLLDAFFVLYGDSNRFPAGLAELDQLLSKRSSSQ
jgi:hypothetical protein